VLAEPVPTGVTYPENPPPPIPPDVGVGIDVTPAPPPPHQPIGDPYPTAANISK
jgi:hypothetical protein